MTLTQFNMTSMNDTTTLSTSTSFNTDNNFSEWTTFNYGQEMQDEFLDSIHQINVLFYIILAIVALFVNLLVILACRQNKLLQYDMYYSQLVNFSLTNIIISLFVLPLTVYHMLYGGWNLGDFLCSAYIIGDVLLPFVSVVILIFIGIDKLMNSSNNNIYSCLVRNTSKSLLLLLPWIIAAGVVIPIWTIGRVSDLAVPPNHCVVMLDSLAGTLSPILTYFLPLVIIIGLSFKIILQWLQLEDTGVAVNSIVSDRRCSQQTFSVSRDHDAAGSQLYRQGTTISSVSGTTTTQARTGDMAALSVMNLTFSLMWFPFQCVSVTLPSCQSETCVPDTTLNQIITLLAASSAGLAPLCWFVDNQLRTNVIILRDRLLNVRTAEHKEDPLSDLSAAEETFV